MNTTRILVGSAIIFVSLSVCLAAGAAQAQDPLAGRWSGTMQNPRGEAPAVAIFEAQAKGYTGSISGLDGRSMIPFKEVTLKNDRVEAKWDMTLRQNTITVVAKFVLAGDSMTGSATIPMGPQSLLIEYKLRRGAEAEQQAAEAPAGPGPEELAAFEQFRASQNLEEKRKLVEEFAGTYPNSRLTALAYQDMAFIGRQLDNVGLMEEYGEKCLTLWQDNYILMTELGGAYVQRNRVDRAEAHALKALELLGGMDKPPQATEEQWQQAKATMLGSNFSTLGFVSFFRAQEAKDLGVKKVQAEKSVAPFKKALEYMPADDLTLYGLGFTYAILNNYEGAESSLAKAVAVNGALAQNARTLLEDIYKGKHNNSLDGLEEVIARAKKELGLP